MRPICGPRSRTPFNRMSLKVQTPWNEKMRDSNNQVVSDTCGRTLAISLQKEPAQTVEPFTSGTSPQAGPTYSHSARLNKLSNIMHALQ